MIEFAGEYTEKCLRFYKKRDFCMFFLISIIVSLLGAFFVVLFAVLAEELWFLSFLSVFVIIGIGFSVYESKKAVKRMPNRIVIEDGRINIYYHYGQENDLVRLLEDVCYVEDYNEWYYIKFNYESRYGYCACEKNRLVEGSIEDFEKLFEGKIVRKYKNK